MAKLNPLSAVAAQVAESMEKGRDKPAPAASPEAASTAVAKTSREGKRFLGYYVAPIRHEEIKQAAMDEGIQVQELMRQAIDAWMKQNGQEAVSAVAKRHERRQANRNS